jgi:hypothetical protein
MVRLAPATIRYRARGVFRTWYAATDGFTMPSSDKPPRGRFDPQLQHKKMPDYIEPADSQSCFSPYTNTTSSSGWIPHQPCGPWPETLVSTVGITRHELMLPSRQTGQVRGIAETGSHGRSGGYCNRLAVIQRDQSASILFPPMFATSGNTFVMEEAGTNSKTTEGKVRGTGPLRGWQPPDLRHPKRTPTPDRAFFSRSTFRLPTNLSKYPCTACSAVRGKRFP